MIRSMLAVASISALLLLSLAFVHGARASAQPAASPSDTDGLWADFTPSYLLMDPSRTWHCSNQGWTYLATSGGASSEAMTCTTPAGNDLSWAGGFISNLKRSGNQVSFDRSNGIFGRSDVGCHIAATVIAGGIKGKQTCKLKYTSPFGGPTVEATVEGPYEAHRGNFAAQDQQSVGCAKERTLRRPNVAGGALLLFENHSDQPLQIVAIGLNGQRVPPPDTLPAHTTMAEGVPSSTPLVLTDSRGVCKAIYIPNTQAAKVAMP